MKHSWKSLNPVAAISKIKSSELTFMKKITPKTIVTFDPPRRNSMSPAAAAPPAVAGLLISLLLSCFAFMQQAQATEPDTILPNGNTAEGSGVLVSLTSGVWNSGFGFQALNQLTAGNQNTATGLRALSSDITGGFNTATGVLSLFSNTSGFFNSATGAYSLAHNTEGSYNTANGYGALYFNIADGNTATGVAALYLNTTGGGNTANGYHALNGNTTGGNNSATGLEALFSNTEGEGNTANGRTALRSNTTGGFNTAIGRSALFNNTSGEGNIALGYFSGSSLTTGDNNIDIGNIGVAGESGTIRIGTSGTQTRTFIAGISGATASGGAAVFVNASGQLGTSTSSKRFKDQIKPMDKASEALLALNPVSFRYKKEIDPEGIPQFGLVAEDVAKVNPDLVVRDADGEIYTVRYDAVNAMLLNEFLKEHRNGQKQDATIAQLKSTVAQQQRDFQSAIAHQQEEIQALTSSLKEQASQLRKVSGQFEIRRPASRLVAESR
jgi:hypothetical protein